MRMIQKRHICRTAAIFIMTLMFIIAFSCAARINTYAATSYPVIKDDGVRATLSKHYKFRSPAYSEYNSYSDVKYAYIYHDGKKVAKFKLTDYEIMECIGKYKGKYYFNVTNLVNAKGVYTYNPGSRKFNRVCKNMNFAYFKKKYTRSEWHKQSSGLMGKRYILAKPYYPTDGYGGYGKAYVYDLKKNKKTYLGNARDIIKVGKRIYWTTTTPYMWDEAADPKIIVKSASISGKNKKTIKIERSDYMKQAGYGIGTINKHYAIWKFIIDQGDSLENVEVKVRYR